METLHAGLVIIVPQLVPQRQRELFAAILDQGEFLGDLVNEVVEITFDGNAFFVTRYALPGS